MTNQRAIILLSQMYLPNFDDEEKDALTKAIEALTEQEPVKAYAQGDGSFACDNCGETVGWEEMNCGGISMIKYKFCPACGRAITWG